MKPFNVILAIMLYSAIASLASISSFANAQPHKTNLLNTQQIEQWRKDIDVMQRGLEQRHIHLYHQISADSFNKEVTRIKQQLASYTETSLRVELMRLIRQVGDGHTQFAYWGGEHHNYPLELRVFANDLRLIGIPQQYQHLLGATLIAIEDKPIEQLLPLLTPILQGVENIQSEQQRLIETIRVAEILQGLNISKSLAHTKFTFKQSDGKHQNVTLNSLSSKKFAQQNLSLLKLAQPENFTKHKISNEEIELFFSIDEQTAYLDFHHYPSFFKMKNFAESLTELLRDKKSRNVIIDFRNNGGGDFFVGLQLAWALIMVDNLNWRDGIYVLTGRKTFSAAMSNTAQYRQLLNATLVGEPTGANPVGYQDAGTFLLPNSGWKVMYSKRFYRFQDKPSAGVQPDVLIPLEWSSYKMGEDNQLNWILNSIKRSQ
jgi:hypothetical protein